MAKRLFPYLGDERLLLPLRDMLDDASVFTLSRTEGGLVSSDTVRITARKILSTLLRDKTLLSIETPDGQFLVSDSDRAAIFGEGVSEVASCGLLKAWLTDHWQEIVAQAAKIRAQSDRIYRLPAKPQGHREK